MSWFKIDDQLPEHRKARAVRRSHPEKRRDVAPFGIWAWAGAWSDDGFVPLEVLLDWDDDAEALAARLVAAGMWHPTDRDGEPGYVFHDWHDQNPVKDDNDPSSTGTFGNHIRWHVQQQKVNPDCPHCPADSSADDRPDIGPMTRPDVGAIGAESLPSRPDPTRPDPKEQPRATRSDEDEHFDTFWTAYDHKVGRKKAESAWRTALKKPGISAELLIAAAEQYIAWQRAEEKHPQYTKHAATWLNGEHWNDERITRQQRGESRVAGHLRLAQELADREHGLPQIGGGR